MAEKKKGRNGAPRVGPGLPAPASAISIERRFEDVQLVYANAAFVRSHLWDVRISFGQLRDFSFESTGKVVEDYRQVVSMSPTFAKRVNQILTEHLREYEERFGEIPVAPDAKKGA